MFCALSRSLCFVLASALSAQAPVAGNRAISVRPGAYVEQRVALVIGNAAYKEVPLRNSVNDARAISAKLKQLGFEVVFRENLTQRQIGPTLREFRSRLTPGAVALLFYAGHGIQVAGVNYFPTVDADIASEEDVPTQSIDLNKVLDILDSQKTRLNLVFLDACRNNPFTRRFRSEGGGLAKITPPSGTILSFATRPGSVAADGTGDHGLYTQYLLAAMDKENVAIEPALKEVFAGVKRASNGKQEPWVEGGIEGNFYFKSGPSLAASPAPSAPTAKSEVSAAELTYWDSIKGSKDPEDFTAYLEEYPTGRFTTLARNRLKLMAPVVAPVPISLSVAPAVAPNNSAARFPPNLADAVTPATAPTHAIHIAPGSSITSNPPAGQFQNRFGMTFMPIPAGSFTMGDKSGEGDEKPEHNVQISKPFAMQTTHVTVKQWKAFVDATGYTTDAEKAGGVVVLFHANGGNSESISGMSPTPRLVKIFWHDPGFPLQEQDHPVVCISWDDAQAFLLWLNREDTGKNYRLPTEAEWEYACRAGTQGTRYGELDKIAWNWNNRGKGTHPVGAKTPNAWGLYDMLGNASQWCQDWYDRNYYTTSPNIDPQGPASGYWRVARGGDWKLSSSKMRSGYRVWEDKPYDVRNVGFRIVMDLP